MTEPLGDIYVQKARFIAELLAENDAAALRMVRAYAPVFDELTRRWQAAISDVLRAEESEKPTITLDLMKLDAERLRLLRLQTAAQIQKFAEIAGADTLAQQRLAIEVAQDHAQALTATALARSAPGFGYTFAQLPRGALEDLIGSMTDGSPLRALFDTMGTNAADGAGNVIFRALATGINPRIAARQLRTELGIPLSRAMVISRTEMLRSYRESNRRAFERNADVCKGWRWSAQLGPRTCPSCWAMSGSVHKLDERMSEHPAGRCFPVGTVVSGPRAIAGTERWYEGDIVEMVTSLGHRLTVTPNHPVLTPHGWIAAGLLREGDDVISSTIAERELPDIPDEYQVPALIEDVARSFGESGEMLAIGMPTSAHDFHGDGVGSDVHVVFTNRLLRDRIQPAMTQPFIQQSFGMGLIAQCRLACAGTVDQFGQRRFASPVGLLGDSDSSELFLSWKSGHHQSVCFCKAASRNAVRVQSRDDATAGDIQRVSNSLFRFASDIAFDNFVFGDGRRGPSGDAHFGSSHRVSSRGITEQLTRFEHVSKSLRSDVEIGAALLNASTLDVSRDRILVLTVRRFSGHVYNLQTAGGWYAANGIVVRNCSMIPITLSWAELGFPDVPAPEPLPGDHPGSEIFRGLDPATQHRILGPGKYDLYKSGAIDLEDVIARHNDPRWGVTTSEASMRGALAQHGLARPWLVHDAPGGASRGAGEIPIVLRVPGGKPLTWDQRVKAEIAAGISGEQDVIRIGKLVADEIDRKMTALITRKELYERQFAQLAHDMAKLDATFSRSGRPLSEFPTNEFEKLVSKKNALGAKAARLHLRISNEQRNRVVDVLKQIRPMGPDADPDAANPGITFGRASEKRARDLVMKASKALPRSWINASNRVGPIQATVKQLSPDANLGRGYYSHYLRGDIAELNVPNGSLSTATHELGHRFEYTVPRIRDLEEQFYARRTAGEAARPLGAGYDANEIARKDKFVSAYMGKDYHARAYELLSMGQEAILHNRYDLTGDQEFRHFILGLLAGI